jgi:hypothetical protein
MLSLQDFPFDDCIDHNGFCNISVHIYFQFKNEAKEYHQERLERNENAVKQHINFILSTTTILDFTI